MPIQFESYTNGYSGPRQLKTGNILKSMYVYTDTLPDGPSTEPLKPTLLPDNKPQDFPKKLRRGYAIKGDGIIGEERVVLHFPHAPKIKDKQQPAIEISTSHLSIRPLEVVVWHDEKRFYGKLRHVEITK